MIEHDRLACETHLQRHGAELLTTLRGGGTVVVNCQEGLHRSVMFAQALVRLCSTEHAAAAVRTSCSLPPAAAVMDEMGHAFAAAAADGGGSQVPPVGLQRLHVRKRIVP
jgi:hypothetical protein